jgi:hypothetical protein
VAEVENWLLSARLRGVAERLEAGGDPDGLWREAEEAVRRAGADEEADVALPVMERSAEALRALVGAWDAGRAPLPEWDHGVLKRAMNAFKRRLKLTRADDEVSGSRNPLSRGERSGITGVRAPEQYPPEVWALLVRLGRLRDAGHGLLEQVGA